MPEITFLPDNKTEISDKKETILKVAQRTNIPLANVCKGNARCSTCRVQIVEGREHVSPRTKFERNIAGQMSFGPDIRLACQTKINGDVTVRRLVLDDEDIELTSLLIRGLESTHAGIEKHVLILFSDIRGFTSLSEDLLPYDVVHILNRYFNMMNEVIIKHGGSIVNYMGDGFMALFEVKATERGMLRGVKAGIAMLAVLNQQIQPYIRKLFDKDFKIGIGMHYGLVVAGTIGSRRDSRYSIIGDAVNFTSRIEASNKLLGTEFLISEDLYNFVRNRIRANKRASITILGKTGTYTLYEVAGVR